MCQRLSQEEVIVNLSIGANFPVIWRKKKGNVIFHIFNMNV